MNNLTPTRADRVAGGLLGLLIGDAAGVPYEFRRPEDLPPLEQIDLVPPQGWRSSYPHVPVGTWSDDGAQALCLLASLLECNGFDAEDFAKRLLQWHGRGYMAVDGHVFDVGIHTLQVLCAIADGTPPLTAGQMNPNAKGNGSLMRTLPLVLWHQGTDEELVEFAHQQSAVTHGTITCQVCCALYCLWGRRILEEVERPWDSAFLTLSQHYTDHPNYQDELTAIHSTEPAAISGKGYVVDCLMSARWAVQAGENAPEENPYMAVVKRAIALGNDTDTTACVAGGIAGLTYGIRGIPKLWGKQLRGVSIFKPLLDRLLEIAQKEP